MPPSTQALLEPETDDPVPEPVTQDTQTAPRQPTSGPPSGAVAGRTNPFEVILRILGIAIPLYVFLVSVKLMGGGFELLGSGFAESLIATTSNPLVGLFIGILATSIVQSSSTTTSMTVGFVAAGILSIENAIPIIMGANIGTTVTNTLVSIGHVRQSAAFRRAFAAATVHDFFNLLCVGLLLPLELMTGFLSKTAIALTDVVAGSSGAEYKSPIKAAVKQGYTAILDLLKSMGLEGTPLAIVVLLVGIGLTFLCLVLITKNMRKLIAGPLEEALNRSLGRSGLIGIGIGILVTIAVQSSSITTSLLVPLCAAGILSLENAFPLMLGANIGTTVTALLASAATDSTAGLTIALVHAFFNLVGTALFYPVRRLRMIPIRLAEGLAERASQNPGWVLAYVGGAFVLIPLLGMWIFEGAG